MEEQGLINNKKNQWVSRIDGKDYKFAYKTEKFRHFLSINDEETVISRKETSLFLQLDEPFSFDNKKSRLIKKGQYVDVVHDGLYLRTGKKYYSTPKWVLPFVGLCIFMPVLGGGWSQIILAIIGLFGTTLYKIISKKNIPSFINEIILFIIVFRGGALPIIFGLTSAYLCVHVSRKELSSFTKIILCLVITVLAWFFLLLSLGIVSRYFT